MLGSDQVSNGKDEHVLTRERVLSRDISWEGHHRSTLITDKELELIRRFDKKVDEVKKNLIEKEGEVFAELFLSLVNKINNNETLQYVLTLIYDVLIGGDKKRVEIFCRLGNNNPGYPFAPIAKMLSKLDRDPYITRLSSTILSTLLSKSNQAPAEYSDLLMRYIIDNVAKPTSPEAQTAVSALRILLLKDEYRIQFAQADALPLLGAILKAALVSPTSNLQLLYETAYCIWLLCYNEQIAISVTGTGLTGLLVEVVKTVVKEKVLRLAIAALRNLLDKSTNNEEMIDGGFPRMLAILSNKKWGDEDIVEDIKVLSESLAKNIVVLSSFDIYKKEVLSGQLEWSPVHKSEKFWRENCIRFEENDYQILYVLQKLLQSSSDPTTLAIACYDLGEFVRFHPRGKSILQQLGIKITLMELMTHAEPEVQKQALYAIQKTMVHNWEYLSSSLKLDPSTPSKK